MLRLMRSELFRLRKRPQSWVMTLIMLAGVVATYVTMAVAAIVMRDPNEPSDLIAPGRIFESGMQLVTGLGYIIVAIVAASIIGNEYGWGTIRPLVARARSRHALIAAKFLTLGLFIVCLLLIGLIASILCSTIGSLVVGTEVSIGAGTLADWFVSFLRLLVAQLPYAALGFFATLLARSTAVGIGVGIGIAVLEAAIWSLVALVTDALEPVRRLGLDYSSTVLFHINAHTDDIARGEAVRAVVILLTWTAIFVGASFWVFQQRDVTTD